MAKVGNTSEFVYEVPSTEEHLSFNIYKSDIPEDVELQFDNPLLNKENSLYLTIQQEFFDEIIAGTKKIEYRLLKGTTYKRMILSDAQGPIPYSDGIKWPAGCPLEAALHYYNEGDFPFVPRNYNFLRFKAGATAKDMDSAVVEVLYISVYPEERFDILKDGREVRNMESGKYCDWIFEFHLGKVRGLHRKGQ